MRRFTFSADTGGTFTDCLLERPDGSLLRGKVLSSGHLRTRIEGFFADGSLHIDPFPFKQTGWLTGKRVLIGGVDAGRLIRLKGTRLVVESMPPAARDGQVLEIDTGIEAPVLGMRLLLEEAGVSSTEAFSMRLGTTKGTNALLENKGAPVALFLTSGFSDLMRIRDQKRPHLFEREIRRPTPIHRGVFGITGRINASGEECQPLDEEQLATFAREALDSGCEVAAVCFLNSWINPVHEDKAREVLSRAGFSSICLSSRIRPLIKYLDRAETTLVDATLSPVMARYLDGVESALGEGSLWVMTSSGGLVPRSRFHAVDSLISGPAGGVIGAVVAGRRAGLKRILTLDMGGTSTDVSRWDSGVALRQHIQVGTARLLTPAMPVETVAAGGGSICRFDGERLCVGPDSAGADPGPAAYGAGGPLTITDLHLVLGRIDPEGFSIPICIDDSMTALRCIARDAEEQSVYALAEGFLSVATERMAQAIRQVSLREGEDPSTCGLVAFGGAGGLHACRVAAILGIEQIVFPNDAGLLSARGIHYAPRQVILEKQLLIPACRAEGTVNDELDLLHTEARDQMGKDGIPGSRIGEPHMSVFMRIRGQEQSTPVQWPRVGGFEQAFKEQFVAKFGYYPRDPELEVVKIRLRLAEKGESLEPESFKRVRTLEPVRTVEGYADGMKRRVPVYLRESLLTGDSFRGPAILRDPFGTCFVEAGWEACCGTAGTVSLRRLPAHRKAVPADNLKRVQATLILNRLEAMVQEMGDQLQRTALSANIRERLDFSCALLDEAGQLLVNAPHIPVHLGAMGLCVRECIKRHELSPGDVLITNHPAFGGSHLPDVTLISGLFDEKGILHGYLANRAHHAEWGGTSPGSMPADAKCLEQEGILLHPQYLIKDGCDQFASIEDQLRNAVWPSRSPRENRIDLEAQLAALHRGQLLFSSLRKDFPIALIRDSFAGILEQGALAMRETLSRAEWMDRQAAGQLDDGHWLRARIRGDGKRLEVDFSGTDGPHPGNLNATPAIVRSALLYVLRLLVDTPMSLNEGILRNVHMVLPTSFLNPPFPPEAKQCPAVVGGNVETSQRLVEVLIEAFGFMAASQGTMNNLLFGNDRFGYYETIGGGAGAGEGFHGASGVHVHMTNTAITDPEILEASFPVICHEFALRRGSGGKGHFSGGDGLVRQIEFCEPVKVSILAQNRIRGARGSRGGKAGQPGRQWRIRVDGSREELPGCAQMDLAAGEGVRIETPGGGGWGTQR